MLTSADAQSACSTFAQVVPTLLIALFVVDRRSFITTPEHLGEAQELLSDVRGFASEVEKNTGKNETLKTEVGDLIEKCDEKLQAHLSKRDRRELRIARAQAVGILRTIDQREAELEQVRKGAKGHVERVERIIKRLTRTKRTIGSPDLFNLILCISFATVGELAALMGTVRAFGLETCLLVAVFGAGVALVNLVVYAVRPIIDDLGPDSPKIFPFLLGLLNLLALAAMILMDSRIEVKG